MLTLETIVNILAARGGKLTFAQDRMERRLVVSIHLQRDELGFAHEHTLFIDHKALISTKQNIVPLAVCQLMSSIATAQCAVDLFKPHEDDANQTPA